MRFLIIKTSALGDIVQSYPIIQYLKQRYPDALIDWVVESANAELVETHPELNRVLRVETKQWRKFKNLSNFWQFRSALQAYEYAAVFDLQGNLKSGLLASMAKSKYKVGFSWSSVPEKWNLLFTNRRFTLAAGQNIREDYLSLVKGFCQDDQPFQIGTTLLKIDSEQAAWVDQLLLDDRLQGRKRIMICPGSAWVNKRLTDEALATLLQKLHQQSKPAFLFAWGDDEERQICLRLQQQFPRHGILLEKMRLPVLQRVMSKIDLVVAMDSLPLHLSGAAGVPTFSFFGASSALKYKPLGEQHQAFQGACPYGKTFEKRCPILRTCATGACIHQLKGDELLGIEPNY